MRGRLDGNLQPPKEVVRFRASLAARHHENSRGAINRDTIRSNDACQVVSSNFHIGDSLFKSRARCHHHSLGWYLTG
jgi:hypothetical protein